MVDMVELARQNADVAVVLYDQFREVGNVLSGFIYSYEAKALESGDTESAKVFLDERVRLRETMNSTDPSDVESQGRLMDEWRGIVRALGVA